LLDKLIWNLETYDIISVRASVPMYFLSKAITDLGIKVVLSGEEMRFLEAICTLVTHHLQNFKETIERVQNYLPIC
jgi:asparagine synthase (glutamine-hydrolysing)